MAAGALLAADVERSAPQSFAWSLTAAIHLVYHVAHLDGFGAADAIAQTVSLAVVLAVPLAALRLSRAQG